MNLKLTQAVVSHRGGRRPSTASLLDSLLLINFRLNGKRTEKSNFDD